MMNRYVILTLTACAIFLGYQFFKDPYGENQFYFVEKRLANVTLENFNRSKIKVVEVKNLDNHAGEKGYIQITYRELSSKRGWL